MSLVEFEIESVAPATVGATGVIVLLWARGYPEAWAAAAFTIGLTALTADE